MTKPSGYAALIAANDNKVMPAYVVDMKAYITEVLTALGQMDRPPLGFPDGVMTMDCETRRNLIHKGWEMLKAGGQSA